MNQLSDSDIQRLAAALAPTVAAIVLDALQPKLVKGDREAAQEIGVSTATLRRYRNNGTLVEMKDFRRVGEKAYEYNINQCRQRLAGKSA